MTTTLTLRIDTIYRNPKQPRKTFKENTLRELADSIKRHGQKEPVIVELIPSKQGQYMLIIGERRWRAIQMAGLKTIEAIVQKRTNHNGREALLSGIIENVQREDMNPIDEARAYHDLQIIHKMTARKISQDVGKSESRIFHLLKLLELPEEIQALIREGKLSHQRELAEALLTIPDTKAMIELARRAAEKKLTVKTVIIAAKQLSMMIDGKPLKLRKDLNPALFLARRRSGLKADDDEQKPARWDAMKQVGKVPAWPLVLFATKETCARCELRDMASDTTCGNCPLVQMLEGLLREVGK